MLVGDGKKRKLTFFVEIVKTLEIRGVAKFDVLRIAIKLQSWNYH